jgi:hypothetical protein
MADKKSTNDTTGAESDAETRDATTTATIGVAGPKPVYRKPRPRVWAKPYKLLFVCDYPAFEMGEDRQTHERKFIFREWPDPQTVAVLTENGFEFREIDMAWIIPATRTSRILCDELAKQFAGLPSRGTPSGY